MSPEAQVLATDDGYRGIWYFCNGVEEPYRYKYSGGLGTYCAKHLPLAHYAGEVNRTFFCYGGRPKDANRLLHMVACYDHDTHRVCRPRILLDKQTDDGHDNVTIMLDEQGYIYLFSSSHGVQRPAHISRSAEPYSIDAFERIYSRNFSYPQAWWIPGRGCLWLHTLYVDGRRLLHWSTSPDGRTWDGPHQLAAIVRGHYQISWCRDGKIATVFNYHRQEQGSDARTNLYYLQTTDLGESWQTITGVTVEGPLTEIDNPALVHDFQAADRYVYLKDLNLDAEGNPVALVVTSSGHMPGPASGPRIWQTLHWNGKTWEVLGQIESDSNYDTGCLHVEADGCWRIIAPTGDGPQPFNPGGEMVMWTSGDRGRSWDRVRDVTSGSEFNHTYARRPVNAHPGFYALWADGHGLDPSDSRLYFCNRDGQAFRLPTEMSEEWAEPEPIG
ncbi:hypothetical protein LCGC14_1484210 [marine sediment metagenome]|uniref:Sialidase domain-containing protein n=1 Tax=marine sediment metagenome TaxID=412755 RepID=A0A0F9MAE9_9ZZZZ